MRKTLKTSPYGPAGRTLLAWLHEYYEVPDGAPLAHELALVADRLSDLRKEYERPSLSIMDRTRLVGMEVKLQAAFVRFWRLAGLNEGESPEPWPTPGRPSEADREARRRR